MGEKAGNLVLFIGVSIYILTYVIMHNNNENQIVVQSTGFGSVIISTFIIGCILKNLLFLIFIYMVFAIVLTFYMEKKYILIYGVASVTALVIYTVLFQFTGMEANIFVGICCVFGYMVCIINIFILLENIRKCRIEKEEATLRAEQANYTKSIFLANMSHEIRTPMNSICGMAELVLREDISDEAAEYTESIQNSGRLLLAIINDILDLSKIESGKMPINPCNYELTSLIYDVVNMMSIRLTDMDVELRVEIKPGVPRTLFGDEIRIRQIMTNLLSNAVKFTTKGYIMVRIDWEKENDDIAILKIDVSDTGIGIKQEDIYKLFNSYEQFDTRRAHSAEGTGLGLAITKQLLELMNGSIKVSSTYGLGTTFSLCLPQKIINEQGSKKTSFKVAGLESKPFEVGDWIVAPKAKILVVDDTLVNLKVAKGLLSTFECQVDLAESGRQCLSMIREKKYDLIFMDHMMPDMDGTDTLRLIRAEGDEYYQNVPVIVLTANVVSGIKEEFFSLGFSDYLPKPIEMNKLENMIEKWIPSELLVVKTEIGEGKGRKNKNKKKKAK